jgi:hypothetical protein
LENLPRNLFYAQLSQRIDHEINHHYRLYPCNYIALDLLNSNRDNQTHYNQQDEERFEQYLKGQLAKIRIPNKDEAFLRERMLTMYANPVRNYEATL